MWGDRKNGAEPRSSSRRSTPALACTLLLFVSGIFAQTLTQADRDRGVQYLEQTRDALLASAKGLSDAQMNFKHAPDRWSVAQTLEHIALVEDFLLQNTKEKVMKAPAG